MAQTRLGAIKIFCNRAGIGIDYYLEQISNNLKWCTKCKTWVDRNNFQKDGSRYDGLQTRCNDCVRVKTKKDTKGKVSTFKGKHHSMESKEKIRNSQIGRESKLKGIPRSEKDRNKISISVMKVAKRGSENPNWKGGISSENKLLRSKYEYKEWRNKVFERDNYICQNCGYNAGGILEAHHIKPFKSYKESRCDVNNGITLCKYCHRKIHTKRR